MQLVSRSMPARFGGAAATASALRTDLRQNPCGRLVGIDGPWAVSSTSRSSRADGAEEGTAECTALPPCRPGQGALGAFSARARGAPDEVSARACVCSGRLVLRVVPKRKASAAARPVACRATPVGRRELRRAENSRRGPWTGGESGTLAHVVADLRELRAGARRRAREGCGATRRDHGAADHLAGVEDAEQTRKRQSP